MRSEKNRDTIGKQIQNGLNGLESFRRRMESIAGCPVSLQGWRRPAESTHGRIKLNPGGSIRDRKGPN